MNYTAVATLLRANLAAVSGLPDVQDENTRYVPKATTPWIRVTNQPIEPEAIASESNMLRGIYQIDVFYPTDKGQAQATQLADTIAQQFRRGTDLSGDIAVRIWKSWCESGRISGNHYQIPVLVRWSSIQER